MTTVTARSTLADVAAAVADALHRAGIVAVLTGGACATFYSDGVYQSHDLDFIVRSGGTRRSLDEAMAAIGFARQHDRYVHPASPFFVEFPRGPLAIGDDVEITPVTIAVGRGRTLALSPTDACRDRLAAFYYWIDRQSLQVAVTIARRQRVDLTSIERWSVREGQADKFQEFKRELSRGSVVTTAIREPSSKTARAARPARTTRRSDRETPDRRRRAR